MAYALGLKPSGNFSRVGSTPTRGIIIIQMGTNLKKHVNQNFFKEWTSEMSYILGYITADGCVYKRKDRKNGYILNITSKDKKSLLKIGKRLSPDCCITRKYNSQRMLYYQIQVRSKEIYNDLISLGIYPRKTYNLGPIKVPDKYFSDFVRGFFDGDGTVYIYKVNGTQQIKAAFVSVSLSFITHFNQHLCDRLNIVPKSIHEELTKGKKMVRYSICFYIDDCEKLSEFMYGNNPSLYLPRKRQIFERWKSIKRRHYKKQKYPSKIGWQLNHKISADVVKSVYT